MKKGVLLAAILMALLAAPCAFAEEQNVWDMAQSTQYGTKAGGMLGGNLVARVCGRVSCVFNQDALAEAAVHDLGQ